MALPKGAELGATSDPKALIVGDKTAVAEQATAILDEHRRIAGLLDTIEGVAIPTWEGGLGKTRYLYDEGVEAEKFETYRDTLKSVSTSLNTYADALGTALDRAQTAIDRWNEGEALTKKALDDHNAAVTAHNQRVDAHNAKIKTGLPVGPIDSEPPGRFVDPGEEVRQEAQEILSDARDQLNSSGNSTIKPETPAWAGSETGASAESEGVFGALGKILGGVLDTKSDDLSKAGASGELKGFEISPDGTIQLFDASGEAHEFKIEGGYEGEVGDVEFAADGSLILNSVSGEAIGKIDKDGLHLGVGAHQRSVEVTGDLSMKDGYLTMGAHSYAYVGSDAEASLEVDKDGVDAGFDLFSGAKAGVDGSWGFGGIKVGLGAEGHAGTGASGDANYGWKDGTLTFGFSAGAAEGVGGKVMPSVELDFPEMGRTSQEIIENPDDAARALADRAGDSAKATGDGARWVAENPRAAGEAALKGATAYPAGMVKGATWALDNPDRAASIADGMVTNPIERVDSFRHAGENLTHYVSENPESMVTAVDKMTVDAGEAKNAAAGVAKAIGGLF